MRSGIACVWLAASTSCRIAFAELPDGSDLPFDALDAEIPLGPWSTPVPIPGADTSVGEEDCTMSATQTELYFVTGSDLRVMARATPNDVWGAPQLVTFNSAQLEASPRLALDGKTLYFSSQRAGGSGQDIWQVTRADLDQPWGAPTNVTAVNTSGVDKWFSICEGNRYMIVRDSGGDDLFEGVLGGPPAVARTTLNSPMIDTGAYLTPDCVSVYFASERSGIRDLYVAHRATPDSPWNAPVPVELNDPAFEDDDPWISPDQRVFLFSSNRAGTLDLYIATR